VFMLGQGTGLLVYGRNIDLIWQKKRHTTIMSEVSRSHV
jgi:lipid-A-disaccharide synthase-like uncharacterized protein